MMLRSRAKELCKGPKSLGAKELFSSGAKELRDQVGMEICKAKGLRDQVGKELLSQGAEGPRGCRAKEAYELKT